MVHDLWLYSIKQRHKIIIQRVLLKMKDVMFSR